MNASRLSRILGLLMVLSVSALVSAQTCNTLIEDAFNAIGNNCSDLDRNTACYGYDRVSATFLSEVADDFFILPSDVTDITELETIKTAGLDLINNIWGVAIMNLQADIPNTIPGQAVTFVLMGDVEVENAVDPDASAGIPDPVQVTVGVTSANIRSGPGLNRNAIGGARLGDTLQADGISRDGEWVRLVFDNTIAWIARALLTADSPVADLPTLGDETRTPMQAFYLRTGVGAPDCLEAPDSTLLIQSPQNMEVELTVNGANIRVGSTILLRILPPGNIMEIIVLDGRVITDDGTIIREGYRSTVCLSEPDNRGVDGQSNDRVADCPWSEPEPIPPFELGDQWCVLEQVPIPAITYPVNLLCTPAERQAFLNRVNPSTSSLQGSSSNLLVDTGADNCAGFGLISPLSGAPATANTFIWSPAPGADQYGVHVYDYQGNFSTSFFVDAPQTSVAFDLGQVASGGSFQWEVIAYRNSETICNTGRTAQQTRLPDPNEPPGGYSTFGVTWVCSSPTVVTFNFSGIDTSQIGSIVIFWQVLDMLYAFPIDSGSTLVPVGSPNGSATLIFNLFDGNVAGSWQALDSFGQPLLSSVGGGLPILPGCSLDF